MVEMSQYRPIPITDPIIGATLVSTQYIDSVCWNEREGRGGERMRGVDGKGGKRGRGDLGQLRWFQPITLIVCVVMEVPCKPS